MPQVLAHITIPDGLSEAVDRFVLHPTAMDAAVHTAPPLMDGWEDASRIPLALPFALEELEVLGSCQEEMWALARPAPGAAPGSLKYDIDLCDDAGMVCVRFKGFSFKVVEPSPPEGRRHDGTEAAVDVLLSQPVWVEGHRAPRNAAFDRRLVVLCGPGPVTAWTGLFAGAEVHVIDTGAGQHHHAEVAARALALVQSVLRVRQDGAMAGSVLLQFVVVDPALALLAGLARVLRREHPKVTAQVVLLDAMDGKFAAQLDASQYHAGDSLMRFGASGCESQQWSALAGDQSTPAMQPWREGGVYLLTGGAGALAFIFAREILGRLRHVTLVLAGRSRRDAALEARLAALAQDARDPHGACIEYIQVDLAQQAGVATLASAIRDRHRRLDGVLHCAGILRDNFIALKTEDELRAVFASKVASLLNLEHAIAGIAPDFMVLFSSVAAAIGNAGQADYAMANAYLDAHAASYNPSRRTLSINWPLWRDGGMALDVHTERWLAANTGLAPLPTAAGLEAFYRAWSTGLPQVMVLAGAAAIEQLPPGLAAHAAPPTSPSILEPIVMQSSPLVQPDAARRFDEVAGLLRTVVGSILKMPAGQLELDKQLIAYGFDSISLTELTNLLNTQFTIGSVRALNPTIFFEHPTLRSLTAYLAADYPEVAASQAPAPPTVAPTSSTPIPAATPAERPAPAEVRHHKAYEPQHRLFRPSDNVILLIN